MTTYYCESSPGSYNDCRLSARRSTTVKPSQPTCICDSVYRQSPFITIIYRAFSALTLLVGWQEGHPACKKTEWWNAGMVICLERGADLHMAQLMPLPLTVSCFSKIQIGFTFLVLAHPGSPEQRAVKRVCVCVCVCVCVTVKAE